MDIFNTFNSEQSSILDQNSINSSNIPFFVEDENIYSIYPKYISNLNFLSNSRKDINISNSEPLNQKNSSNKEIDKDYSINIENLITIEKNNKLFGICRPNKPRRILSKRKRSHISPHDKYKKDNVLRKVKIHSINFILKFVNFLLEIFGFEEIRFRDISYIFKKDVKTNAILSLKKMTIKEIICQKLSTKFKLEINKDNTNIFESNKDNPIIKKIFEKKYLEIFKEVYCSKEKKINLKDYDSNIDRIIIIPERIKIFKDLLKNNINDYRYLKKLEKCVNNNFLINTIIQEN